MSLSRARLAAAACALLARALVAAPASDHGRSPHVEVQASAIVESVPRKTVHHNGRRYEEFDVRVETARVLPGAADSDPQMLIERKHFVHVVHDLSCGGAWVDLKPGQHVRLQGEYVHPPRGKDIIHFTHPADASCGRGEAHPDGFLRATD